jgi:Tol biopolymer transport system component
MRAKHDNMTSRADMNSSMASACVIALLAATGAVSSAESTSIVPAIFSPGVVSGPAHDSAPAFAPSGKEIYFGRSSPQQSTIVMSERGIDGQWSQPRIAPFSGTWNDMEPAMSPDGRFLVFVSNRPDHDGGVEVEGFYAGSKQQGGRLWRVDRLDHGWSAPVLLPPSVNTNASTFAPSVAADASLYFMTTDAVSGKFRLFRAQFHDGSYSPAQPLPFSNGTVTDVDPAVAPDESFLVFGSGRIANRGIDLFIVFHNEHGWGEPIHLGNDVNTPKSDAEPRLAPDGDTLYFSSERVVPVQFPRTPEQAGKDVARMQSWDNGNYNIWQVPLAPLLERARRKQ